MSLISERVAHRHNLRPAARPTPHCTSVFEVRDRATGAEAPGWVTVRVCGDLDLSRAPELRDAFSSLGGAGAANVLVDLTETEFIDSAGLSVLIGTLRRLEEDGRQMRVLAPRRSVAGLLRLTGVSRMLPVYESAEAAERDLL